jgi:hypothetical protein
VIDSRSIRARPATTQFGSDDQTRSKVIDIVAALHESLAQKKPRKRGAA